MFIPRRWNSTPKLKPRESGSWLTLAMTGDCRTSRISSTFASVAASLGTMWLLQMSEVWAVPLPVCQMPYLFGPIGMPDVWKPQAPRVVYSHEELAGVVGPGVLPGCRTLTQPPLLWSKFQGTLSPADGPVLLNRMPRSRTPFGM